jgi:hypothetical protein
VIVQLGGSSGFNIHFSFLLLFFSLISLISVAVDHRMIASCFVTLLLLLWSSSTTTLAFTQSITIYRSIDCSVDQAFRRCLRGWSQDNFGYFGLPSLVPKPALDKAGDPDTGLGMEVTRSPPLALKEGITDYIETSTSKELVYRLLNPGWLTFPVSEHQARIRFDQEASASASATGCQLEWTVEFSPLPVPFGNQQWERLVEYTISAVINRASDYIAETSNDSFLNVGEL